MVGRMFWDRFVLRVTNGMAVRFPHVLNSAANCFPVIFEIFKRVSGIIYRVEFGGCNLNTFDALSDLCGCCFFGVGGNCLEDDAKLRKLWIYKLL